MTPSYRRNGCSIVDATGLIIYRDLVQFTDAALDRLVDLLNADAAEDWADFLRIMEREAAAGQYVLYYRLEDDLDQVDRTHSLQAEEDALAAQLVNRVKPLLMPQLYAALQMQPHWADEDGGPQLRLQFTFEGRWLLEHVVGGWWFITYPGDNNRFFVAYSDAGLRQGVLAALADWRVRSDDAV